MKKVLWFILLMILNTKFILATEIIYSDYSEYSEYTDEYVQSSELVDVITEDRYLWYKEEQTVGNYELSLGNEGFTDCYETDYSKWSTTKEEKIGRIYEERTVYNYELSNPLQYIHLTNLHGSYGAFRIPELIVKVNGIEIDYDYICEGCFSEFGKYIHNGIYNENKSYISNGGSLIIDLKKQYPAQSVEVIFYIFDLGNEDKKYNIGYSYDMQNIYASKDYMYEFSDEYWVNSKLVSHYIYDLGLNSSLWTKKAIYYTPITSEYIINDKKYQEFRYKERYCRKYTNNKIYSTVYTSTKNGDFDIKDETTKKTFYAYRTREKMELKDNLVINSYNYDLNNFILYSSSEYEIIDDININKNGIYSIIFENSGMKIEKLVEVNIKENTINQYQEEISALYEIIDELNTKIKELEHNFKTELEIKNNEINELKNELKTCKENCEEKINCLTREINEKNKIIEEYELGNNKLQEELEKLKNKINDSELEKNESINKLNSLVNELETDIKSKEEEIKLLIEENNKLKENLINLKQENNNYINKINNLEKINEEYITKLTQLELKIKNLNEELSLLNEENIDTVNKLTTLIDIYKEEIKVLNEQIININLYITQLKESSNFEIEDINDKLNETSKINKEYYEKIIALETNIQSLTNEILILKQNEKENEQLTNEIKLLEDLNIEYLNKIKELENQIHNININIKDTINSKNQIIETYKNEIITIKQEKLNELENLNNQIEEKNIENISLNEKLNNYMLNIKGKDKLNLFWLYIFVTIFLLVYIFLRKKSSKK